MPTIDTPTVFAVLGPLFLLLGAVRCIQARALPPQARTWLLLGLLFCIVAAWLWWGGSAWRAVADTGRPGPLQAEIHAEAGRYDFR